ncbi:MAG: hypothetical protein U0176_03205 [Bacteroidia bacterium]
MTGLRLHFPEGNWRRRGITAILSNEPEFAMLMTYVGKTAEAEKNYPEAIKWYRLSAS